MQNNPSLHVRLRRAGRRLWLIGLASGLLWGVFAALVVLLFAVWLDFVWELSPIVRIAFNWGAAAWGFALLVIQAVRVARAASPAALARRLDIAAKSCGAILTGLELDREMGALESRVGRVQRVPPTKMTEIGGTHCTRPTLPICSTIFDSPLTVALAKKATEHAATLARRAPLAIAVPVKPLGRALAALIALMAAVGLLATATPGVVTTEWNRFRRPLVDLPPFSLLMFHVEPGDTSVRYGEDLEISANVDGPAADPMALVLRRRDGSRLNLPMFREAGEKWQTLLSRVTEPTTYYIRSGRARSAEFEIAVVTVPRIETVRIKVTQPANAGNPSYEGSLPGDGVKGLNGSTVTVWATSNLQLSGGKLTVTNRREATRKAGDAAALPGAAGGRDAVHILSTFIQPMQPATSGGKEVVSQFQISGDGTFAVQLIDEAGRSSQQLFCGDWHGYDAASGNSGKNAPGKAVPAETARLLDDDAIPPRYRRAVNQYFQRLSEESSNR